MARIGDAEDAVEPRLLADRVVGEERLRHGGRIGKAGRLDQIAVEPVAPLAKAAEHAQQVAAHRAAQAAVVQLEHLLVGADDERAVDADLAELVDDHGEALAVRSDRMRFSSVVLPAPRNPVSTVTGTRQSCTAALTEPAPHGP